MLRWLPVTIALCAAAPLALAEKPLHRQIDQAIDAGTKQSFAKPADDATFLRRIYLDLVGDIPTAVEARAFLESKDRRKRSTLLDSLLDDSRFARNMAERFHVMLMERRGDDEHWQRFLEKSFVDEKPWDQLVRSILDPSTEDEANHGSNYFLTKRLEKYGQNPTDFPGLASDIGRMFLGVNLQCAQCHDHLFVDDYKQADFQGMYAFAVNTFIRSDVKFPAIGERVMSGPLEFKSVFEGDALTTGPRIYGGNAVEVETFEKGQEFAVVADSKTKAPGIPKFSPLRILAEQMPTDQNTFFARNGANRLWYLLLGHGIVYPLDMHHADNPPSHPQLLDLLAEQWMAHDYDVKWLLREIALSDAYQRSGLMVSDESPIRPAEYRIFKQKGLSAEQLCWSMLRATGKLGNLAESSSDTDSDEASETSPVASELDEIRAKFMAAYANPPREPELEFTPSVRAALFLLNDETLVDWLSPGNGNLAEQLLNEEDMQKLSEELYLSVLSRFPTRAESGTVVEHIEGSQERATAVSQLIWALLASTEFTINH